MTLLKSLQLNMHWDATGQPATEFVVEHGTGDKAMGTADREFAMQMISQFYPAEITAMAVGLAAAAATVTTPTTPSTPSSGSTGSTSSSGTVGVTVTLPIGTIKVGL